MHLLLSALIVSGMQHMIYHDMSYLYVVLDEMPDHVGDVLVDQDDCNVISIGKVLEGILYLLHRRLCNIIQHSQHSLVAALILDLAE